MYPTTETSKIFTVFFAFGGIGILAAALSVVASAYFEQHERMVGEALHRKLLNGIKKNSKDHKRKVRDLIKGSEH